MTPEQMQQVQQLVGFTFGMVGAGWLGYVLGYMRGYRQVRRVLEAFTDRTETAIDEVQEPGVASAALATGNAGGSDGKTPVS